MNIFRNIFLSTLFLSVSLIPLHGVGAEDLTSGKQSEFQKIINQAAEIINELGERVADVVRSRQSQIAGGGLVVSGAAPSGFDPSGNLSDLYTQITSEYRAFVRKQSASDSDNGSNLHASLSSDITALETDVDNITSSQWTTSSSNIYFNTGNIGIGTTSPYAKLSVVGEAVAEYFTATSTTATSTFSGGLIVGSPTEGPAGAGTVSMGDVNDRILLGRQTDNKLLSILIDADPDPVFWVEEVDGNRVRAQLHGGNAGKDATFTITGDTTQTDNIFTTVSGTRKVEHHFRANVTGNKDAWRYNATGELQAFLWSFSNVNTFIMTDDGRLGIGTTSPYAKLSVVGETVSEYFTATSTTATSTIAGGLDVGSGNLLIDFVSGDTTVGNQLSVGSPGTIDGADLALGDSTDYWTFGRDSNDYLARLFMDGASDSVFDVQETDAGGRVQFSLNGTVFDPDKDITFSITGSPTQSDNMITVTAGSMKIEHKWVLNGVGSKDAWKYNAVADAKAFWWEFASGVDFVMTDDGRLGIATTSPDYPLDVNGDFRVGEAGSTNALFVDATNGEVGIGTDSPGQLLDIEGVSNPAIEITETGGSTLLLRASGASTALLADEIRFIVNNDVSGIESLRLHDSGGFAFGDLYVDTDPGEDNMIIEGNVGIATTTPWRTLSVDGTAAFTSLTNDGTGYYACISTNGGELATSTTACGASSQRFKKDIETLSYGLDDIRKLNPVSFEWKEDFIPNGTPQIGFIAEEVESIIPEVIGYDSEGEVMNLDYPKLTAVLTRAVQDIANLTESFRAKLISWFADRANGIGDFFADRVVTKELCLEDVCITKSEFKDLLEKNNVDADVQNLDPESNSVQTESEEILEEEVDVVNEDTATTTENEAGDEKGEESKSPENTGGDDQTDETSTTESDPQEKQTDVEEKSTETEESSNNVEETQSPEEKNVSDPSSEE